MKSGEDGRTSEKFAGISEHMLNVLEDFMRGLRLADQWRTRGYNHGKELMAQASAAAMFLPAEWSEVYAKCEAAEALILSAEGLDEWDRDRIREATGRALLLMLLGPKKPEPEPDPEPVATKVDAEKEVPF